MLGDCDLAGLGWMLELLVRALGVLVIPTIREKYFLYLPRCHLVPSLQLYYTHYAHKCQGLLQKIIKKFQLAPIVARAVFIPCAAVA